MSESTRNYQAEYSTIFNGFTVGQETLQGVMIQHLAYLHALPSKADVLSEPSLRYLFSHTPKGVNRGALSAWWVAVSPLRPVFKANGQLEVIRWANNAKWDLDGAKDLKWWDAEPEATTKVRVPELDKAVEALILACAKISRSEVDYTPEVLAKSLMGYMDKAEELIKSAAALEKVNKFAEKLAAQKIADK